MHYDLSAMAGVPLNVAVTGASELGGVSSIPTTSLTGQQEPWTAMLSAVRQFVTDSMPLTAVAHSYHVDALADPALRADPIFEQFSLSAVNALHHQVAMLGSLLRMEEGDPTAFMSLARDLHGFLVNREEAARLTQAMAPAMLQHPALQSVVSVAREANRHLAENWHNLTGTLALAGIPAPAGVSITATAVRV